MAELTKNAAGDLWNSNVSMSFKDKQKQDVSDPAI